MRAIHSFFFFIKAMPKSFPFKKEQSPLLKKSESLFHKERIALVFEKSNKAIHSFCSSCSFKKSSGSDLLPHFFCKEGQELFAFDALFKRAKRAKEQRAKEWKTEFPSVALIYSTVLRRSHPPPPSSNRLLCTKYNLSLAIFLLLIYGAKTSPGSKKMKGANPLLS